MRALLLALLLFVAPAIAEAPAAMKFEGTAVDALLTREPCTQGQIALGLVMQGFEPPFYAGVATSKDKSATFQLCWVEHPAEKHVDIYDELGNYGYIKLEDLKPVRPI